MQRLQWREEDYPALVEPFASSAHNDALITNEERRSFWLQPGGGAGGVLFCTCLEHRFTGHDRDPALKMMREIEREQKKGKWFGEKTTERDAT